MLHLQAGIEAVRLPLGAQAGRQAQGRRLPREGLEPIDVSHSAAWPKGAIPRSVCGSKILAAGTGRVNHCTEDERRHRRRNECVDTASTMP